MNGSDVIGPLRLEQKIERWQRKTPARITGYTWNAIDVLVVHLSHGAHAGFAEGVGVYYGTDNAVSMMARLEELRTIIEAGLSRESIQRMLPPGGARNALDCAFWDLEAKVTNTAAWRRAGLDTLRPLHTTMTCHADTPEKMAAQARDHGPGYAIKLKLTGEEIDRDRICAVREALPDAWLGIDANQGFSRPFLARLMPLLIETRVALIEQPFPIGRDDLLEGFASPIPIAADESMQSMHDIATLVGRYQVANIKLDKCGGLTEGLAMARALRSAGLAVMVGSMGGTSLAMAPAFLVGQLCDIVDLDGPSFLIRDRQIPARYVDGHVFCPPELWGAASLGERRVSNDGAVARPLA